MARPCTVCRHPGREEIDAALAGGASLAEVGGRFGLKRMALSKHRRDDLPASLTRAVEVVADRRGESLAEEINRKKREAEEIGKQAQRDGDGRTALMAVKVYSDLVELMLKAAALVNQQTDQKITVVLRLAEAE